MQQPGGLSGPEGRCVLAAGFSSLKAAAPSVFCGCWRGQRFMDCTRTKGNRGPSASLGRTRRWEKSLSDSGFAGEDRVVGRNCLVIAASLGRTDIGERWRAVGAAERAVDRGGDVAMGAERMRWREERSAGGFSQGVRVCPKPLAMLTLGSVPRSVRRRVYPQL